MTANQNKNVKVWNVCLWIAQIALAAMFLMVGAMKAFTPLTELVKMNPFAAENPGLIRFIGISELVGGLGLLLPSLFRVLPNLTTWASAALGLVMVLAMGFHAWRGESIVVTVILLAIALFITWGRIYKAPIRPRTSSQHSIVH